MSDVVYIPEAVYPGEYTKERGVKGAGITVMPKSGVGGYFKAPDDNSPGSIAVRAHEYGHLALESSGFMSYEDVFFLCRGQGVNEESIQLGMDTLVNHRHPSGIYELPIECDPERLHKLDSSKKIWHTARAYSVPLPNASTVETDASICRGVMEGIIGASAVSEIRTVIAVIACLADNYYRTLDVDDFVDCVCQLDKLANPPPTPPDKDEKKKIVEAKKKQAAVTKKDGSRKRRGSGTRHGSAPANDWAEMRYWRLNMDKDVFRAQGLRRWKLGFVGAMRAPHRVFTDFRMYGLKKKIVPDNILLDMSGSMSLQQKDVDDLLRMNPGMNIAGYCGGRKGGQFVGYLIHIAQDGWVAPIEEIMRAKSDAGSSNMVDGPALDWLNEQEGRVKVWIGDGQVNGKNGNGAPNLILDASMKVAEYGIKQYVNIYDFLESNKDEVRRG